jgi:hypothetical protein
VSVERLITAALLVVGVVLLARQLPEVVRILQTYRGTGQRRQVDATGRAPEPVAETAERVASLEALGYHLIGTTRTDLPIGVQYGRILGADDQLSYVIVVDSPAGVPVLSAAYTAWPDGTWIGTMHPSGDTHRRPGLELLVSTGSITDAVEAHRARMDRLRPPHGQPRRISHMADVLALDAEYRERFGGRELRPLVIRAVAPWGVLLGLTILMFYMLMTMP